MYRTITAAKLSNHILTGTPTRKGNLMLGFGKKNKPEKVKPVEITVTPFVERRKNHGIGVTYRTDGSVLPRHHERHRKASTPKAE